MYDTLIIGAGFSGLAAGVRLAHYGQKVAILERHYTIGGLNSTACTAVISTSGCMPSRITLPAARAAVRWRPSSSGCN
jgi:phytoene dehydrogenase-like protein